MSLTVVTHTNPDSGRDISKCIQSVEAAMPRTGAHYVLECRGNLQEARWKAAMMDEFVCFVDDDDYISQDSLSRCVEALNATGAGMAFTNEVLVDGNGKVLSRNDGIKNYDMIPLTPMIIHHMSVVRRSALSQECYDIAVEHGCGIEWLMKAHAALKYGAVHVPIDGYFWVQHGAAHHMTPEWQSAFLTNTQLLTPRIRQWLTVNGPIPQY